MDEESQQDQRESFLIVFYVLVACGATFLLVFAICGGIAVQMTAVAAGVGVFGLLHWWLWGSRLSRSLAADQPADEPAPPPEAPPEEDPYRGRY